MPIDSRTAAARALTWTRRYTLLVLLPTTIAAATVTTTSCMARRGPSNVAQGLEYHPKQATFDPFFAELFRVQLVMGGAVETEAKIRQRLARKLGIEETTELAPLSKAIHEHTERLALAGVTMRLVTSGLDPSEQSAPSVEFQAEGTAADRQQRNVVLAIERAAKDEARLLREMREAKAASERLGDQAPALEPAIEAAFLQEGPGKRAEVKKNLDDAQRLIPLMIRRAAEVAESAEKMLDTLEQNANSAAKSATEPVVLEEAEDAGPPAPRPKRSPAPRRTPSPSPAPAAPASKPPPPPADDFEP